MGLVRILAVEDFWGCHSQPVLRESTESEILGEGADGPEAIRMSVAELQPDLVRSDIKLPELNGLDAARKIQQVSPPASKMVFVCQEWNQAMIMEAQKLGAQDSSQNWIAQTVFYRR